MRQRPVFTAKVGTAPATSTLHLGEGLNANEVIPRLWQGGLPPTDLHGFNVLVLAATSYQPPDSDFPGVRVIRIPLHDPSGEFYPAERTPAVLAAYTVAQAYLSGATILVTCRMGWNRSGLITALTLRFLGYSADQAVDLVRKARGEDALSNPAFEDFVRAFKAPASEPDRARVPKALVTLIGGAVLGVAFAWFVSRVRV
jgi:hypothetical protein